MGRPGARITMREGTGNKTWAQWKSNKHTQTLNHFSRLQVLDILRGQNI